MSAGIKHKLIKVCGRLLPVVALSGVLALQSVGLAAAAGLTVTETHIVSNDDTGAPTSGYGTMSSDARYVTYETSGNGVVPGVTIPDDMYGDPADEAYVVDRQTNTTSIVSLNNDGTPFSGSDSSSLLEGGNPLVSDNGQYVAFEASTGIYLRDLSAGTTAQISPDPDDGVGLVGMSGDASTFLFHPPSPYLQNPYMVFNRLTGASAMLDIPVTAAQVSLSHDGKYVFYNPGGTVYYYPGGTELDEYDVATGQTEVVFSGSIMQFSMSPDNTKLAYSDIDGNIYVHNLQTGQSQYVANEQGFNGPINMSDDGRYVTYDTPGNGWLYRHLWVADLATGQTVTVDPEISQPASQVSGDGSQILYTSYDIDPGIYPLVMSQLANLATVPTITSSNSATTSIRSPLNFQVTTTGGPTPTISESGALPSGVTFSDNGDGTANFSGLPAAGASGVYPITITATNSAGTATQSFSLTITNVTSAPTIISSSTGSGALTATAGQAMTPVTFTASGYKAPKVYVDGSLPRGLSFHDNKDGTASLFGTPTTPGTYTFTITASNKDGSYSQTFVVVIS